MKYKDVDLLREHERISVTDKELIRSGNALAMLPPLHSNAKIS